MNYYQQYKRSFDQDGNCFWCSCHKYIVDYCSWQKISARRPKSSKDDGFAQQVIKINLSYFKFFLKIVQGTFLSRVRVCLMGHYLLLSSRPQHKKKNNYRTEDHVQGEHRRAHSILRCQPSKVHDQLTFFLIFMIGKFRDFIDAYLIEIQKGTNSNFDLEGLELTCLDLFKAGAETSSTTILWVILYLVKYPEAQEACYQEVISVTGEERPGLNHNLPYCQAVIHEVQRLACVAPQTIPHRHETPEGSL